jgi:hypothetical protein
MPDRADICTSRSARLQAGCFVAFAKCVVLIAKVAFPAFQRPAWVHPIIHNVPAYECLNPLRAVPAVKDQAVTVVGAIVYIEPPEPRDNKAPLVFPTVYAFRKKACLRFWRFAHPCIWERRHGIAIVNTGLTRLTVI